MSYNDPVMTPLFSSPDRNVSTLLHNNNTTVDFDERHHTVQHLMQCRACFETMLANYDEDFQKAKRQKRFAEVTSWCLLGATVVLAVELVAQR